MKMWQTDCLRISGPPRPVEPAECEISDRAYTILFHPEARRLQDACRELLHEVVPELRKQADAGGDGARRCLERFASLGEQLGIAMPPDDDAAEAGGTPLLAKLVADSFTRRRVPAATYRLQFNPGFTFRDAHDLAPYLDALGITDCYASPILQARAGSCHGYDICDHGRLNPELGGERVGMGQEVDNRRRPSRSGR